MTETLANGYSFESSQRELSNEYQHDRVTMIFKNLCILVIWIEVALALEGLSTILCLFSSYHQENTARVNIKEWKSLINVNITSGILF